MKRLLCVLSGVAMLVGPALAQDSAFRLYLSEQGVEGNTPLGGITPMQDNPRIIDPAGGTHRLYVWGQVIGAETPQQYISVGYNVVGTGGVAVTDASTWNYSNILYRWTVTNVGQLGGGSLQNVRLAAAPVGFFGVADNAGPGNFDQQYDPATTSSVLGWIEVQGLGEVFLQIGAVGIIRTNTIGNPGVTWDDVYLGFGDENAGLLGNSFDISSPIAEAKIVPEPAGLLLLGLAGLAIRRR